MKYLDEFSCGYQDLDAARRFFTDALGFVELSARPDRVELVLETFSRVTATQAEPGNWGGVKRSHSCTISEYRITGTVSARLSQNRSRNCAAWSPWPP